MFRQFLAGVREVIARGDQLLLGQNTKPMQLAGDVQLLMGMGEVAERFEPR